MTATNYLEELRASVIDSDVYDPGWAFKSEADVFKSGYVAMNLSLDKRRKVIIKVKQLTGELKIEFYISQKDTEGRKCKFQEQAKVEHDQWFTRKDGCGIFRTILLNDVWKESLGCELDDIYESYSEIAGVTNEDNESDASKNGSCIVEVFRPYSACGSKYEMKWNGWEEYWSYWDSFVKDWYDSKACPKDAFSLSLARFFAEKNGKVRLNMNELPEPYYGCPQSAKGVLVNLNPGMSDANEVAKFFPNGELVREFSGKCEERYSKYSKEFSSLTNPRVCGYEWWHDSNHRNWLQSFFSAKPDELFVLEACPYHSATWNNPFSDFSKHIVDRVVSPALATAVLNEELPCAVFIGSCFSKLIAEIKGVTAVLSKRGTRHYTLYSYPFPFQEGGTKTVYVLVINGCQGMKLPSNNEANITIETEIKSIINGRLAH